MAGRLVSGRSGGSNPAPATPCIADGRARGAYGRILLTMVFIERDARWLLLHMHASIAVPNERITPP